MNLGLLLQIAAVFFLLSASLYAADTTPAAPAQAKPASATSAASTSAAPAHKTKPAATAVPVSNVKSGDPALKPLRIAYVVQRSLGMTDAFASVKDTIRLTLKKLNSDDQFYLSFYPAGPVLEVDQKLALDQKWVPATEDNKQRASDFVDAIFVNGYNKPSEALRRAFDLKPDVIYLLSNALWDTNVPALIDQLNAKHKVSVNTVCFVYSGGEKELKKIAEQNHGAYIFVSEDDWKNHKLPVLVPAPDAKPPK